jgi:signal transduction histidine kinase
VGILLVDHSTGAAQENLRASFYEMIIKASTTVLAILVVLGLLMNRIVISRIKRLTAATSQIASQTSEELDLRNVEGSDEIGQLARSFQKMAHDLRTYLGELEEKERIRVSLLQRLVRSQEEERKTISRELHDQLGQSLSALLLEFQTRFSSGASRGTASERDFKDFEERITKLIEEAHRLAWQMRPSILDDYGLERAVERYVEETSKTSGVSVDFQQISADGLDRLPHWLETTLYRVAQEGISNVVRHSEATQASLVLIRNRTNVTLLIEDNGIGFDPRSVEPTSARGLGMLGMKERVTECGGTFEVESAPLKGTTIRAQIPLGQNSKWQSG